MYEIYQRLLDEKGLKNSDVSRGANVSNMTLSDWKHGKSTPKSDKLQRIADFLDVSIDYLVSGKEPEFSSKTAKIDAQLTNMSDELKEYALKLANLPVEKQKQIMSLIDML